MAECDQVPGILASYVVAIVAIVAVVAVVAVVSTRKSILVCFRCVLIATHTIAKHTASQWKKCRGQLASR